MEESTKSKLQVSFNKLKALAHEAIKKCDGWGRQRDEALCEKEEDRIWVCVWIWVFGFLKMDCRFSEDGLLGLCLYSY